MCCYYLFCSLRPCSILFWGKKKSLSAVAVRFGEGVQLDRFAQSTTLIQKSFKILSSVGSDNTFFPECHPAFLPAQPQSLAESLSAFWPLPVVGLRTLTLFFCCIHSWSGLSSPLAPNAIHRFMLLSLTFLMNSEQLPQNIVWISDKQLNISPLPSSKIALLSVFPCGKSRIIDQPLKLKTLVSFLDSSVSYIQSFRKSWRLSF